MRVERDAAGPGGGESLALIHSGVVHGRQLLSPDLRRRPLTYFGPDSGIGLAMRALTTRGGPLRVGVVGLGTGTLAAYGRAGDVFRFYEIDPAVGRVAQQHFTYLSDSPARIELAFGDGRLALEREASQAFDLLALDAFSGDAVPVHLLTEQAFDVYLRHLAPSGVLAVQVTNRNVDLLPVVAGAARRFGLAAVVVASDPKPVDAGYLPSDWVLLARDAAALRAPELLAAAKPLPPGQPTVLWTDDRSNLLRIMR
jgi:spermidine synthase